MTLDPGSSPSWQIGSLRRFDSLLIQELLAPVFVGLEPDLMLQTGFGQVYLWCLRYFECSLRCWMRVLDPGSSPG